MSRNDLRYELKLASEVHLYEEVRALLRLHSVGLSPIHHPRKVQSLYFDSSTDEALGDNLAGISHREKIRFRWYGVGTVGVRGRLEKKVRENMQGWKELGEVDGIFNIEGARREEEAQREASAARSGTQCGTWSAGQLCWRVMLKGATLKASVVRCDPNQVWVRTECDGETVRVRKDKWDSLLGRQEGDETPQFRRPEEAAEAAGCPAAKRPETDDARQKCRGEQAPAGSAEGAAPPGAC